jgi:hypothetical protein
MGAIDVVFDPVVGRAATVLLHVLLGVAGFAVQRYAVPKHLLDAVDHRAVRVVDRFDLGVMLAMHGHPLTRHHAGADPAPEAEEVRQRRVKIHAAVGLAAVQVQRHREDGELGRNQQVDQHFAPACAGDTVVEEVEHRVEHRNTDR